jgi:hypothetical protein
MSVIVAAGAQQAIIMPVAQSSGHIVKREITPRKVFIKQFDRASSSRMSPALPSIASANTSAANDALI